MISTSACKEVLNHLELEDPPLSLEALLPEFMLPKDAQDSVLLRPPVMFHGAIFRLSLLWNRPHTSLLSGFLLSLFCPTLTDKQEKIYSGHLKLLEIVT